MEVSFFMAKYSFEFKKMVVKEYVKGLGGYTYLAKKHGIKNKGQVHDWVKSYQEFGEEGLQRRTTKKDYSVQFKIDAVELYSRTELTYREVANQLGMNNPALVIGWQKKFLEKGIDGLSQTKGRPSKMPKKTPENKKKSDAIPTKNNQVKELEKQIRLLEIENAYLKELRRRGLTDPEFLAKIKRESPTTSEKKNEN